MTPRTRRAFLADTATVGGGLLIAFSLPACSRRTYGEADRLETDAALSLSQDGTLTFTLARTEFGQGTLTSEAMMVAEELSMDPSALSIVFAPAGSAFANPEYGVQVTGGSNSTRTSWSVLRRAGAMMREAVIGAAAAEWGIDRKEISLSDGQVRSKNGDKSAGMGTFAAAARAHVDPNAAPKPPSEWLILGRTRTRLDAQSKVDGSAKFGADSGPADAEVAVVVRGPYGSTLRSFDAEKARDVAGVLDIFAIPSGVAVVARHFPTAKKAAEALELEWTDSDVSTDAMMSAYGDVLDRDDVSDARSEGNLAEALQGDVLEAEYRLPFLAHAAMEPVVATARVTEAGVELWVPTQAPGYCATQAAKLAGCDAENVTVHQTLLGGAFGRKTYVDFVEEAVHVAMRRDKAVRLMWSREDDIRHGPFRPASLHRFRGRVQDGAPVAWEHRIVAQTAMFDFFDGMLEEALPRFATGPVRWGLQTFMDDPSIVEGAAELPYAIDNVRVAYNSATSPIPCGFWRSVGHSHNGFVVESFIDELAHRAGADPVEFRRGLLRGHDRHLAVLDLVAKKAGWSGKLPPGWGKGVAVHESFKSLVAQVAEVSIEGDEPRVRRVVAAVDCGRVLNPDGVRAQIESGIVFGLSAAVAGQEITVEGGRVKQSNFHDYPLLRGNQCPEIEVHMVPSEADPSGVGEPGTPPIAAAVANAIFAATGQRLRSMPLRLQPSSA